MTKMTAVATPHENANRAAGMKIMFEKKPMIKERIMATLLFNVPLFCLYLSAVMFANKTGIADTSTIGYIGKKKIKAPTIPIIKRSKARNFLANSLNLNRAMFLLKCSPGRTDVSIIVTPQPLPGSKCLSSWLALAPHDQQNS